jgi:hypothetical protein
MSKTPFASLPAVADQLRKELEKKKFVLLYAHNGTGKTRLSTAFKDISKKSVISALTAAGNSLGDEKGDLAENEVKKVDTLYFNAFTEDLFSWDNDLENDVDRMLKLNPDSSFFDGPKKLAMEAKIEEKLERYVDFGFYIDYDEWFVTFFRERDKENNPIPIKVSRGEENIFIWCFFLAIVQIAIDDDEDNPYDWVKYIYIDDPISSLDEHNAIKVAHDLIHLLSTSGDHLRIVISTHHVLFYNVIANQVRSKASKFYLAKDIIDPEVYVLENWENVPPFHHLSTLVDLCKTRDNGELNSHHFNMLRRVLEQTAAFFGHESWTECLRPRAGEAEKAFQKRILDLNSHGDFVIFESPEINNSMRTAFHTIFEEFRRSFPFNPAWFPASPAAVTAPATIPPQNNS